MESVWRLIMDNRDMNRTIGQEEAHKKEKHGQVVPFSV